jgi:hypothetical protein
MSTSAQEGIQTAGDVKVIEVVVIKENNEELNVLQMVGEINIFEDMFKNGLYGNVLLIDAGNFVSKFPIVGNEFLRLQIRTPQLNQRIYKTFKVYSITNRMMIQDTSTQSYILHFCSTELFIDMLSPVYSHYRGPVSDIVTQIYQERLAVPRNSGDDEDVTPLVIVGETDNEISFTSPGWHATHCINWLAARTLPRNLKSPAYLFYETTQAFYFANIEAIIDLAAQDKVIYREYNYVPANITGDKESQQYRKDVERDFSKIEELEVVETFNAFKNVHNGYYANRLVTLDILSRKYEVVDYDHVASYKEYKHLEDIAGGGQAPFSDTTLRGPSSLTQFYPKHEKLFNDLETNANNIIDQTLPRRVSTINELGNFKIVITVPGRTDAEVGSVVYLHYPDASPRDQTDKSKPRGDPLFSGYYLVTAVRHKITLQKHMMIMELVKDSYRKDGLNNE